MNSQNNSIDHDPQPTLMSWAKLLLGAVLCFTLAAVVLFKEVFWNFPVSRELQNWGQMGDFFGGMINPVVGLATVILLFINIRVQNAELKESIKQIKISNTQTSLQSFEQSLFAWLTNYQNLIGAIEYGQSTGRTALFKLYTDKFALGIVTNTEERKAKQVFRRLAKDAIESTSSEERDACANELKRQWSISFRRYHKCYRDRRSDLDATFRTIYRLLRWIDTAPITEIQKWHYVALVRAQLSWIELVYLFFNGLTVEGEEFAKCINKYAIFDNLAKDSLPLMDYLRVSMNYGQLFSVSLYGFQGSWTYEESAFESKIAKHSLGLIITHRS